MNCFRASNEMITDDQVVTELTDLVIEGKDTTITFEEFPFYLSEKVKILLTSAGYVHLSQHQLSKHTSNLSPPSQAILLSGPAECYHKKLAEALAHYFESKLLFLDINHFISKMESKCKCATTIKQHFKRFIPDMTLECVSGLSGITQERVSGLFGAIKVPLKCKTLFSFVEKRFMDLLHKVLVSTSKTGSVIVFIKDADKAFLQSASMCYLFKNLLKKFSGSLLILGSQISDSEENCIKVDEKVAMVFPCNIEIKPPQDNTLLEIWKSQLEEAMKETQLKDSRSHIAEVLAANEIVCDDLNLISNNDVKQLSDHIEEIAASAVFYQLMDKKHPEYQNEKLLISAKSLCHVLSAFQEDESIQEIASPDNEFEKSMRQELIPAKEIKVTLSDIGALDDIKESLQEAILLPLRRPELFKGEGVLKPCKGVLLFGPPGTGKTMLAKAIANEAGASFINVSPSTIGAMLFGQSEKNVRALFSLASKLAPTIIFIDEVDSILGKRSREYGNNTVRSVTNEFMSHWDGLLSKPDEKIIVLAATNVPFDLDEAIIRRFQRRIMVGLPSAENRELILKTLLAKEKYVDIDFKELSTMTEGFSGSDLKNLCVTAAYRPMKELLQQEREKKKEEVQFEISEDVSDAIEEHTDDQVISLRPLNMEDMRHAKNKVAGSFAADGSIMKRLEQWNDLYGERG